MIDTIVLTLNSPFFYIVEPDRFEPSARWVNDDRTYMGSRSYLVSKQNPTKTELLNGIYKPRLSLTNRFDNGIRQRKLKIELSLPKLLYGNNFSELKDTDFPKIISLLNTRINEMGVDIGEKNLISAPVSTVHYSKNIPLTDGTTPYQLINKIKEANISFALDINKSDYQNDGHCFKWHANSYEVVFYDKIEDLKRAKTSEKRAVEKSDNLIQMGLFDLLEKNKRLEVLRTEIRLNRRQKIKSLFQKLNIENGLTFRELFSQDISRKVLLYYLNEVERSRLPLQNFKGNDKDLLASLIIDNPGITINKTLQLFGLKQALNNMGIREMRKMFQNYPQRSLFRLISEAKTVKLRPLSCPFQTIRDYLTSFEPINLLDFQRQMLNNDK